MTNDDVMAELDLALFADQKGIIPRPTGDAEYAARVIAAMLAGDAVACHCERTAAGGWLAYFGDTASAVSVPFGRPWADAVTRAALAFLRPEMTRTNFG